MYAVRLLPQEYQETIIAARKNRRLLLVECIIAAVLAVAVIVLNLVNSVLNQELSSLRSANDMVFQRIESLKPVETLQSQVQALSKQMDEALGTCPDWGEILPMVGNALPPNVFLTDLQAGYANGASAIVMTGFAPDHDTVSRLMSNLADISALGEITCRYSTAETGSRNVYGGIQFELTITVIIPITNLTGGSGQ